MNKNSRALHQVHYVVCIIFQLLHFSFYFWYYSRKQNEKILIDMISILCRAVVFVILLITFFYRKMANVTTMMIMMNVIMIMMATMVINSVIMIVEIFQCQVSRFFCHIQLTRNLLHQHIIKL